MTQNNNNLSRCPFPNYNKPEKENIKENVKEDIKENVMKKCSECDKLLFESKSSTHIVSWAPGRLTFFNIVIYQCYECDRYFHTKSELKRSKLI